MEIACRLSPLSDYCDSDSLAKYSVRANDDAPRSRKSTSRKDQAQTSAVRHQHGLQQRGQNTTDNLLDLFALVDFAACARNEIRGPVMDSGVEQRTNGNFFSIKPSMTTSMYSGLAGQKTVPNDICREMGHHQKVKGANSNIRLTKTTECFPCSVSILSRNAPNSPPAPG